MQSVEKSNVWTDVAVRTSSWRSDDKKLVKFFQNPHVVNTIVAGFSVSIPFQSILYGT